ncbi:MAG: right-handed parallel beta-helix repeat-containing protein [Candidatus Marinimicrobia bacterium]|nr:right-handed parallel beta-helix repeat-containing protein [Candidatus Neomarinimicrobiota bacterium]
MSKAMDTASRHGLIPRANHDCTPALHAALAACQRRGAAGLVFGPGTYHFYPAAAPERHCWISNNDSGFKRIAFHLRGLRDFVIEGRGAHFLFHGRINPFVAEQCAGLCLRGFTVDWDRSFVARAEVLARGRDWMDLRLPPGDPGRVVDGRLVYFDDVYAELRPYLRFMEYDLARRRPLPDTRDWMTDNRAEELEAGTVRVRGVSPPPRVGATLVIKHQARQHPAIVLDHCRQTRLEELTLHHSCGMGIIAQNCRDVNLNRVRVTPTPDSDRLISTQDDATHFVNCSGKIGMADCLFENQWDDGTNVHGIYQRLRQRLGVLMLEVGHYQQLGIAMAAPGETLEFINRRTLLTYHQARIKSVTPFNPQFTGVTFHEPLPAAYRDGDAVANLDRTPALTIRDCVFRNNKPRGILVTTPRRVLIEKNTFQTAGAAIYISGDANFWFESGGVRDVTIRRNLFEDCNFMTRATGQAVIDIAPEIAPRRAQGSGYHQNIRITDNVFRGSQTARRALIRHRAAQQVVTEPNRIEPR